MPHPVRHHDYVFHQFPEWITLSDGRSVIANDQAEKDAFLEADTAPATSEFTTVTDFKRGPGRPKKIV